MVASNPIDVLVVGAGPTGLPIACELARHGLLPRLIDELSAPVTFSKAAVVHSRTMDIFDDMGIAEPLAQRATPIHGFNAFTWAKRVAHVPLPGVDSSFPLPREVSQRETEAALAAHFASLGGVVERDKRLVKLEQDGDGLRVTLASGETIAARWVIGCDGAHSFVRKELGCSLEGAAYEERLVQADVHVDIPGAPSTSSAARATSPLFEGAASTAEGYGYLARIATHLEDRLGAWLDVHIVVPSATKPPAAVGRLSRPRPEVRRTSAVRSSFGVHLCRASRWVHRLPLSAGARDAPLQLSRDGVPGPHATT